MIKFINENFSIEKWEKVAKHPLQSWWWGEARKETSVKVVRLGEFEKEKLKNVFQFTVHKVPVFNFKIAYLPRSVMPSKSILDKLYEYAKKEGVAFVKIEPYEKKGKKVIKHTNLRKSPHPLFPKWTIMLDLDKSEEELLANMKRKTRYNIRLAQRKGVKVREMSNEKGFNIFLKLHFETCKRQKYRSHTPTYHKIIWKNLKEKIAHILIAFYKNTPLAAYEIFLYKNTLYYPYGGSAYKYRNLMASNILMWEAIKFGKRHGAKVFDMWGSLPPNYDKSHPWAGFTRFKEGYGGEFVEFIGSWDLVVDELKYKLFSISYKLRNIFLKLI